MAGGWIIRRASLAGLVDARKVGLSGASLTGKDALEHISDHVGRCLAHGPLAAWRVGKRLAILRRDRTDVVRLVVGTAISKSRVGSRNLQRRYVDANPVLQRVCLGLGNTQAL